MSRRVLCFGDSNTYGYDPRPLLGGRYPEHIRWTCLLQEAGWDVLNMGENGRRIPRLEWEVEHFSAIIQDAEPEVLTVMLGTNDILQRPGLTAELCARRMEEFLSKVLETVPVPKLLVSPPPLEPGAWGDDSRSLKESCRLADCYQALAEKLGISFADAGTWQAALSFDGVHLSPEGHRAFAKNMDQALKKLLCGL